MSDLQPDPASHELRSVLFIGGGNMATALLGGLLKIRPDCKVQVVEPKAAQAEMLATVHTRIKVTADVSTVSQAQVIVLAVKPQVMKEVCQAIAPIPWLQNSLVISIAAGTTLDSLQTWLGGHQSIIRCMPNTPALIGQGITGLIAQSTVTAEQRLLGSELLQCVGENLWFEDESLLDTVTAVSGSGPAYVFYFLEALQAAGEAEGLTREQARLLALKTVTGAALLATESRESFATLRERVTSKGGTTAAAMKVLIENKTSESIGQAVRAARRRAAELSRGMIDS